MKNTTSNITNIYRMPFDEVIQIPVYSKLQRASKKDSTIGNFTLTKNDIKCNFPANWLTTELCHKLESGLVEYATTSGTTSGQMNIFRPVNWWKEEYLRTAEFNYKLGRVYSQQLRKAVLTTAQCSATVCYLENPKYDNRIIKDTLYLNNLNDPSCWQKTDIERIIDEMNLFKPNYIDVDPIYFALFLSKKDEYNIKTAISLPEFMTISYEFCTKAAKHLIAKKFPVAVHNLYGSTETGYIFVECDQGKLHLCEKNMQVSFEDLPYATNAKKILISAHNNPYMPLINYDIGDLVICNDCNCKCGEKGSVVVERLMGRLSDALILNQKILTVADLDDAIFELDHNIFIYELIRLSNQQFLLKYRAKEESISIHRLKEKLEDFFGVTLDLKFQKVREISPQMSGKFKLTNNYVC